MSRLLPKVPISLCAVVTLLAVVGVRSATTDHEDHDDHDDHDDHEEHDDHDLWELGKVYDLGAGVYTIQISPADGEDEFEDDHVAFMAVSTSTADEDGLEEAEEHAESAWEEYLDADEYTEVDDGNTVYPSEDDVYLVHLESVPTEVYVNVTDDGAYALLLEMGEEEITVELLSSDGTSVEAAAETEHEDEHDEDEELNATDSIWGNAIAASIVVSLCSLVGIIFTSSGKVSSWIDLSHASMLAAGALLTTAFLHIIPEGIESLNSEYDDLHKAGNRGGIAVLVGLGIGIAIHAMVAGPSVHDEEATRGADIQRNLQTVIQNARSRKLFDITGLDPICWNVILGDFVHNFGDGILIGTAFLACDLSLGWVITASTVLHELPAEVADFMALLRGGMSLPQAYLFNFLSAVSAVFGVLLILGLNGEISAAESAFILLVGGGSFLFIGLTELIPEALEVRKGEVASNGLRIRKVVSFVVGALLIGIPLMWDRHCDEAHDHDH